MVHSGLLWVARRRFADHRRKNACGSLKCAWMPSGTMRITCDVEWMCTDYSAATEHASLSATMSWHCYRTRPCASLLSILMWSCPETGQQTEQPKQTCACACANIIVNSIPPCQSPLRIQHATYNTCHNNNH